MNSISFKKSNHENIEKLLKAHLSSMPYPLDSYMEAKLKNSEIKEIEIDTQTKGYIATIEDMIWFFYVSSDTQNLGPIILEQFIKETGISKTTVLTCDSLYNAVLSDFTTTLLSKEGCYFVDGGNTPQPQAIVKDASFRLATEADLKDLLPAVAGYYSDLAKSIKEKTIYLLEEKGELLGCGSLNPSTYFPNWVSLGITVLKEHRKKGVAKTILWHLKQLAYKKGLRMMAGCWYYNTLSRKSLEGVNMVHVAKELCLQIGERDKLPLKSGNPGMEEE